MRRTNIYLSDEQQAALDAIAAVEGSTRSDVLRSMLDRELHLVPMDEVDQALAAAADEIARAARRASRSDPDLRT